LFVDRNLSDNDLILALRAFEFTVTSYYDYYTKDRVPDPQLVPDEDIISECSANNWVLVTADKNLEYRHFAAIKNSKISIFIVPDNCTKPTRWAKSLLDAQAELYRAVKNYRQPFVGRINGSGKVAQLRCIRSTDAAPKDCALLIQDGVTDHACAKKFRKAAGAGAAA
jgi:hypothetical protein